MIDDSIFIALKMLSQAVVRQTSTGSIQGEKAAYNERKVEYVVDFAMIIYNDTLWRSSEVSYGKLYNRCTHYLTTTIYKTKTF